MWRRPPRLLSPREPHAARGVPQESLSLADWRALSRYDLQSQDFSGLESSAGITLASPRRSRIVYNATLDTTTVDLQDEQYCDVQGNLVSGKVTLPPFESKILIALAEHIPALQTTD